jgi:hypothetical protein
VNYEFHLEDWLARFPLREKYGHYSGDDITSPCNLCNVEWLRRGMIDEYDWESPVPVDIFVMSSGEPANRYATKIGGLPYRPASAAWPCAPSGRPLALIAQFNFTNSIDIVGELPGDLLLVFGDYSDGPFEPLHLEWQRLGIESLIQPSQLPRVELAIAPCFGNRCRLMSYPNAVRKSKSRYPQCYGKDVWSDYWIPQLQATQIGRAPYFIQEGDNSLPGQPICTIASVQPDPHQPYPWVNVPEPLCPEGSWPRGDNELMIGDLGCIYIFMEDDGTLHTGESCY